MDPELYRLKDRLKLLNSAILVREQVCQGTDWLTQDDSREVHIVNKELREMKVERNIVENRINLLTGGDSYVEREKVSAL